MAFRIEEPHPLYIAYRGDWLLMRDAFNGEDTVKSAGERYLPMKSGVRAIADSRTRDGLYSSYATRAEFPEIVAPTVRGALGMIHERAAQIKLPPLLEPLRERATKDRLTLEGLHRRITAELLQVGRYGLLPGFGVNGPHLAGYPAEAIVSWDSDDDEVTWVALDESGQERDRESNIWRDVRRFRELRLDDGVFVSREWTAGGAGDATAGSDVAATQANTNRTPLSTIPFVFINSLDLTPEPDDVPLYGLAKIAVRMYRLDADYMHGMHMTSEPTPWVSGYEDIGRAIEEGWVPNHLGSSQMIVLPHGGQAGFLEFSGPGLAAQATAIQSAREAAVMFGAQLFTDNNKTAESGEARRLRIGSQTATWKDLAATSAAGLERALRNLAVWMGLNPDQVEVVPNLDFIDQGIGPQEIAAIVKGWQDGAYSWQTSFERLKAGKIIPPERTAEEELDLLADERADGDDELAAMTMVSPARPIAPVEE